jgi:single-strand DNA-binding protein
MYHKIILVGNLGRDPEMRYTPSGQQVTTFSMATSEKWTGQDGQLHDRTIWWKVTVWGKQGENANTYLKKGSKVLVEGRMQADDKGNPRIWTRQDGTAGASFEVTALTIKYLSAKNEGGAPAPGGGGQSMEAEPTMDDDGIPF